MPYKYNPFTGNLDFFEASSSSVVSSINTDSGGPVTPAGGTVTITGGSGLNTSGSGSTVTVNLDSPIVVSDGGTGRTSLTDGAILVGDAANPVEMVGPLTNGQLLIGDTAGVSPVAASLTQPLAGISIAGGAGSITFALANDLAAVEGIGSNGMAARTGTDAWTTRTVTGTASRISVSNGDGVSGNPTLDIDAAYVGQASITTLGTITTGTWNGDTITVAYGGTGSTSYTAGSVIFSNGSILTEDNSNLFWDDTNNRLGIGLTSPLDTLHVTGNMEIDHTAAENDDHALEIVCDANGFTDVKGLDIDYITGAVAAGEDEEAMLVNIDETASTGGIVAGYLVLTTAEGSATINGYETGINVNPIVHESGTFGNADNILNIAVDVTAALASGGAGSISIFVNDNDTITIGDAATWDEMEIILGTGASGAGVAPTFEYSTGGAAFSAFSPADGTNGFRNTGAILWDSSTLAGWATAASGRYEIRITRTRNTLATTPIIDELQIAATTEYKWDKNGDVNIKSLTLTDDLTVANGGTGASTFGDGYVLLGSGTGAITALDVTAKGSILVGDGTTDPVALAVGTDTFVLTADSAEASGLKWAAASGGGLTWNEETGTSANMSVNNGYIANNAALVTLTIPTTAAVGDVVRVAGKGAGGWRIAQNASEIIHFLGTDTTTGTGGRLDSTTQYDAVELVCTVANTEWTVISSMGNITIT